MFSLQEQPAQVTHINTREEKHGEDGVLAIDIDIQADIGKDFLLQLAPRLGEFLYDEDKLRFQQLEAPRWKCGIKEASLVVNGGSKKSTLAFVVNIKHADLEPLEGGTVVLKFRAATNPVPDQVGVLSGLLGKPVKVSLVLNDLFSGQAGAAGGEGGEDGPGE